MLHTVPLQSLLDWLSKPKGPNLVEASVAAAPEKALVLVVTKKMLYAEEPPLVGVGLMYKLHYDTCDTCGGTTSHLIGCGIQTTSRLIGCGIGGHW